MNPSLPRRWLVPVLDPDHCAAPYAIAGENRRPGEELGLNPRQSDLAQGLPTCFRCPASWRSRAGGQARRRKVGSR